MPEVEDVLTYSEEDDPEKCLEDRSTNCMSWFTGLLLPGKSMPFILMNALIDCDNEPPVEFRNLSPSSSNIGFQYRGCTYWSWECIVGKVMGAAHGVKEIAGWIGPCPASADLDRSEVTLISQAAPKSNHLTPDAVQSMAERSAPTGPAQDSYAAADYELVVPATDDPVDSIRIERLNFSPAASNPAGIHRAGLDGAARPIVLFDASVTFAITVDQRARSWKVSLRHDTPFVAAYPCANGPHPLYADYLHQRVRVDELVDIQDWGARGPRDDDDDDDDDGGGGDDGAPGLDDVLVIEAFGVPDNEVFARAWCAFWGLPSVTADLSKTCMACAVREAYAALVSVVILVERASVDIKVEDVDRLMEGL